jgi:hypothetical protein
MKKPKRGRPPPGRKAMTAAERQARRRKRVREAETARLAQDEPLARRPYQPPHGYPLAKERLLAEGHRFERARHEFGFEEGVFVDGAFLSSDEVIALAALPPSERQRRLTVLRHASKDFACDAVEGYLAALQVSRDELIQRLMRNG